MPADLAALADLWRWCAEENYADSPLYAAIARGVADDAELIGLTVAAGTAHAQFPNVLMAAVHEQVLLGGAPDLAEVYMGRSDADPFTTFRRAALDRRDDLLPRMATCFTNTNEVGRSAVIALALAHVAAGWDTGWALVEAGASAGINLCYDRFHLDYGTAGALGDLDSPVRVDCTDRTGRLVLPPVLPVPTERVGLDRDPIDLTDAAAQRWLLACTWPDSDRVARTATAHQLLAGDPPRLVAGDLVTDIGELVAATAPGLPVAVLTTWVLAYLTPDQRTAFADALAEASRDRTVAWISAEASGIVPLGDIDPGPADEQGNRPCPVGAITYDAGAATATEVLGACHHHGRWIDWWGAGRPPSR